MKSAHYLFFLGLVYYMTFSVHGVSQCRSVSSLNNDWKFLLSEKAQTDLTDEDAWANINVPHTWNKLDIQSGNKVHFGTGWYRKTFKIKKENQITNYFLKFEGVGQHAMVYLNDKYVGEHLGSYAAFTIDVSKFIQPDTLNTILVRVNNELSNSYPKDNFLFGIYGGIYRPVSLIGTSDVHIDLLDHGSSGVYVKQSEVSDATATLEITTLVKNETSQIQTIKIKQNLLDKANDIVASTEMNYKLYPGGTLPLNQTLILETPHLWNGKYDPYLFKLQTEILQNDVLLDRNNEHIGIRSFHIDEELGFILNGKPYRLYGVCRHQEWEDLGNALSKEHHQMDMELIQEMGATSIRLAHYQQADYFYHLADSIGMLVWAEIPFVNGYQAGADDNAVLQLTELIKQNYNAASIFVWGLHNEVIKGKVIQEPVLLTERLQRVAKTLDPQRYTVGVSNIWWVFDHPIHEIADLQGFNQYTGWYGGKPYELRKWIRNYHSKKPAIRFCVSEYGAGGNIKHQSSNLEKTPDPKGTFFPETYQTYYHEETWAAIEEAPFIWASYVWNMFDFAVPEWDRGGIKGRNHKGLISYDRQTKKDAFYWYQANWSEEPVLHLAGKRHNVVHLDSLMIKVYCNFAQPELWVDGKLTGVMTSGINKVQFLGKDLELSPGEHDISVRARKDDLLLIDEMKIVVK